MPITARQQGQPGDASASTTLVQRGVGRHAIEPGAHVLQRLPTFHCQCSFIKQSWVKSCASGRRSACGRGSWQEGENRFKKHLKRCWRSRCSFNGRSDPGEAALLNGSVSSPHALFAYRLLFCRYRQRPASSSVGAMYALSIGSCMRSRLADARAQAVPRRQASPFPFSLATREDE